MTPAKIQKRVIADRAEYIREMAAEIRRLPLESFAAYSSDKRNIWASESCLRRALEALLDMGRHILAKSLAKGVTEYRQIAEELGNEGVITRDQANLYKNLGRVQEPHGAFLQRDYPQ